MVIPGASSFRRVAPIARATVRLLLASVGGYALAAAVAAVLARGLPMPRAEAAVAASLAALLAMPAAAIWAYAVPRLWNVAAGILGVTAVCGGIALLIGQPG